MHFSMYVVNPTPSNNHPDTAAYDIALVLKESVWSQLAQVAVVIALLLQDSEYSHRCEEANHLSLPSC